MAPLPKIIHLSGFQAEADQVMTQLQSHSTTGEHCGDVRQLTLQIQTLVLQVRLLERDGMLQQQDQIDLMESSLRLCYASITRLLDGFRDHTSVHSIVGDLTRAERSLDAAHRTCLVLRQSRSQPQMIVTYSNMTISGHARVLNGNVYGDVNFKKGISDAVDRKRKLRSRGRRQYQMWIRPWFMSQIWDFSFSVAAGGWDQSLRTYNIRSWDSDIFFLLRREDFRRARELISLGRASPFDVEPDGTTMADNAMYRGSLEFCLEILNSTGSFKNGYSPLTRILTHADRFQQHSLEDVYRIIVERVDWDFDELDDDEFLWCFSGTSYECFSILQRELLHGMESEPVATKLELHWKWRHLVTWSCVSSTDLLDRELWLLRDNTGQTALHRLADSIGKENGHVQAQELLRSLVEAGADLHAQDNNGRTPLQIFIVTSLWHKDSFDLELWICHLLRAGVNVLSYGRREIAIWNSFTVWNSLDSEDGDHTMVEVTSLTIDKSPLLWTVELRFATLVPVCRRVARDPPGAWPSDCREQYLPSTICWEPEETDPNEDDWRLERVVELWLSARPVKTDRDTTHLRPRAEDDSSNLIHLRLRSSRKESIPPGFVAKGAVDSWRQGNSTRSKRSASQPRLVTNEYPRVTGYADRNYGLSSRFCFHHCTLGSEPRIVVSGKHDICSYACIGKRCSEEALWEAVNGNIRRAREEHMETFRYEGLCKNIDADYAARYHI